MLDGGVVAAAVVVAAHDGVGTRPFVVVVLLRLPLVRLNVEKE